MNHRLVNNLRVVVTRLTFLTGQLLGIGIGLSHTFRCDVPILTPNCIPDEQRWHTGSQRSFPPSFSSLAAPGLTSILNREFLRDRRARDSRPSCTQNDHFHPAGGLRCDLARDTKDDRARTRHGRSNRSNNKRIEVTALRYTLLLYGHSLGTVI
jgi:hypothetical protein